MGRPGRKRSAGKRTASGRGVPANPFDHGSPRVQAMREKFGEHYSSALGRLFAKGFLGDGQEAKDRLDAGKRFARLYDRIIDCRPYRCALNVAPRGSGAVVERESDSVDQDWLFESMEKLGNLRPWLDQLISKEYVDVDPVWVSRLLRGGKDPYDWAMLKMALAALDVLAPKRRKPGVLVAVYG